MTRDISAIQTALAPVFDDYGISRAILFGSVAKGTATEKSDLDLLVDSKLRGLKFVGFMEAVHQAVGMPVDILNVSHIEKGSRIEHEINSTGVTIYEKNPHLHSVHNGSTIRHLHERGDANGTAQENRIEAENSVG